MFVSMEARNVRDTVSVQIFLHGSIKLLISEMSQRHVVQELKSVSEN